MILFCTPDSGKILGAGGWAFLGAGAKTRDDLRCLLETPWTPLDDVLREEEARLRAPFREFAPAASEDLFQLCCLLAAGVRLAGEERPLKLEHLTLVVEDPWLFRQLKTALEGKAGVSFAPEPGLGAFKRRALLRRPWRMFSRPAGDLSARLAGLPVGLLLERSTWL